MTQDMSLHKILMRTLRPLLLLLLVIVAGANEAWGQVGTDFSGTYYIANHNRKGTSGYDGYNPDNISKNFYLRPSTDTYDVEGEKPFLTTKKDRTNGNPNPSIAKWRVVFAKTEGNTDYYYLIHSSNKYLTWHDPMTIGGGANATDRVRLHLQSTLNEDKALFYFTEGSRGDNDYNICLKGVNCSKGTPGSLNPAKDNKDNVAGVNISGAGTVTVGNKTIQCGGLIGIYERNDLTGVWYLEDVIPAPTINRTNNTVSISYSGSETVTIYYTTDGSNPVPGEDGTQPYTSPITLTSAMTAIKAVAVKAKVGDEAIDTYSKVSTIETPVLFGDANQYLIQSTTQTDFYLLPSEAENVTVYTNNDQETSVETFYKLNTNNLHRPSMLWYFTDAGTDENGQRYCYIVNGENGKYVYYHEYRSYDGKKMVDNYAISMALADDFDNSDKYKFTIIKSADGYYICPKQSLTRCIVKNGGNGNNWQVIASGTSSTYPSQWNFIPANDGKMPTELRLSAPVELSTDSKANYYTISNTNALDFFIVPTSPVAVSNNTTDNDKTWYVKEAKTDDWLTYYYIINAQTGKYLYYEGSTSTDYQNNVASMKDAPADPSSPDSRYLFLLPKSTAEPIYIVPEMTKYTCQKNHYCLWRDGSKAVLRSKPLRGNNDVMWNFTPVTFQCATPVIAFSAGDNGYVITTTTSGAAIYYTIDGNDPADNGTLYTSPIATPTSPTTIRAIAVRNSDKSDKSVEGTFDVTRAATPTFSFVNNKLVIECATSDATIYYTTNGSVPTTESSVYMTPLQNDIAGKTIKAIAVTPGLAYSEVAISESVTLVCATPNILHGEGKSFKITCDLPTEGVTIYYTTNSQVDLASNPQSGTPYTAGSEIPFEGDEVTVWAIAIANGYSNSAVAQKTLAEGLRGEGTQDDPYLIDSDSSLDLFVSKANESGSDVKYYKLTANVSANGISAISIPFIGHLEGDVDENGNLYRISDLSHALINTIDGGTVNNIILEDVDVSGSGNVGALCNEATGATRIYNCGVLSGSVSGSGNVGGLVGRIAGNARVINCYSFATVGSEDATSNVAGVVGNNDTDAGTTIATVGTNTMVMNCVFYGTLSGGAERYPVYGGRKITNAGNLNGYNYYRYDNNKNSITTYNCALAMEEEFLNRFEFFRYTLNSNRELAAWYAVGDVTKGKGENNVMAKWVLDKSIANYPILKKQGYYPSVINYDEDAAPETPETQKELTINISVGSGFPSGAAIKDDKKSIERKITDKDPEHRIYNYHKVQLPYYNEVGTGNCTKNKVVTGWKITGMTGGTQGHFVKDVLDYSGTTHGENEYPPYNFADRFCKDKDLYGVSGRVFSQGAYFDVPDGVSAISIEPYWGTAVYLSDQTYDVSYPNKYTNAVFVNAMGTRYTNEQNASINGDSQPVYTNFANAIGVEGFGTGNVYDNAIVLVGNYHHYWGQTSPSDVTTKSFTIMSADFDNDCEPDYGFIVQHGTQRQNISPIRFDFINSPGLGLVQKVETDKAVPKHGIWWPKGWFEVTNTTLIQFTQFEYDDGGKLAGSPLILLGGIYDQFVTSRYRPANSTEYIHMGSNVWMKEFCNGTHTANANTGTTRHIPISVTGGEFESFNLTGNFQPNVNSVTDNAECYINGGKFGEMAGAGQEQLKGDVTWLIDHADIEEFYGGGVNSAKPVTGNIWVTINNSQVNKIYCGGPKFGNMSDNMKVTTSATGTTFKSYYGAGYGGNAYYRYNRVDSTGRCNWDVWVGYYDRNFVSGKGISTEYEYEFIPYSGGQSQQPDYVGRFYVKYASLSLAATKNVESTLNGCTITDNFYGGGRLGRVEGNITSTLTNCTIQGNAYGAGFSPDAPTIEVWDKGAKMDPNPAYNESIGVFDDGVYPSAAYRKTYTWVNDGTAVSTDHDLNDAQSYIYTTTNLKTLGEVTGDVTLNINGTTTVGTLEGGKLKDGTGNVFGAGDASNVSGNTIVNMTGGSVLGSIYGGGNVGSVGTFNVNSSGKPTSLKTANTGKCTVTMSGGSIGPDNMTMPDDYGYIFGAGKGYVADPTEDSEVENKAYVYSTDVTVSGTAFIKGSIYGGSENGHVLGDTYVKIRENCQIGNGYDTEHSTSFNRPYTTEEWTDRTKHPTLYGCAHWPFDEENYHPYDRDAEAEGYDSKGGVVSATDGHTFYGNVFGGGSGLYAYKPGQWLRSAGRVEGNTRVDIEGGHILSNVYGGCETTDVNGTCTINMSGGTIGVPRTNAQIQAHPMIGYLYGAGKGDERILFNTWTNVDSTSVNVTGGTIYSSVYGGGEDGHVLTDAVTTIDQSTGKTTIIGTAGTSGYDGNVFGGGRGFSGTALTAGVVGGNVTLNIQKGSILGSVYGGGRNASVGTFFSDADDTEHYGKMQADTQTTTHGHISLNMTGGTVEHDVFGGGMGIAGNENYGLAKDTRVVIKGGTVRNNVYGGGNAAIVLGDTNVMIGGE